MCEFYTCCLDSFSAQSHCIGFAASDVQVFRKCARSTRPLYVNFINAVWIHSLRSITAQGLQPALFVYLKLFFWFKQETIPFGEPLELLTWQPYRLSSFWFLRGRITWHCCRRSVAEWSDFGFFFLGLHLFTIKLSFVFSFFSCPVRRLWILR